MFWTRPDKNKKQRWESQEPGFGIPTARLQISENPGSWTSGKSRIPGFRSPGFQESWFPDSRKSWVLHILIFGFSNFLKSGFPSQMPSRMVQFCGKSWIPTYLPFCGISSFPKSRLWEFRWNQELTAIPTMLEHVVKCHLWEFDLWEFGREPRLLPRQAMETTT